MPDFYVMSYGGHRSAPLMLAALAGIVHDRQRANGSKHEADADNDQRGLHGDLATAGRFAQVSDLQTEHRLNALNARLGKVGDSSGTKQL
jgi:hypothetical protein